MASSTTSILTKKSNEFSELNSRDHFLGFQRYCWRSSYQYGGVNDLYIQQWMNSSVPPKVLKTEAEIETPDRPLIFTTTKSLRSPNIRIIRGRKSIKKAESTVATLTHSIPVRFQAQYEACADDPVAQAHIKEKILDFNLKRLDRLPEDIQRFACFVDDRIGDGIRTALYETEYSHAFETKDIIGMWTALKKFCLEGPVPSLCRTQAVAAFEHHSQSKNQSFDDYVSSFDNKLATAVALGEPYTERKLVELFYRGLNKTIYSDMTARMQYDETLGLSGPKTLDLAKHQVRCWNATMLRNETRKAEKANAVRETQKVDDKKTSNGKPAKPESKPEAKAAPKDKSKSTAGGPNQDKGRQSGQQQQPKKNGKQSNNSTVKCDCVVNSAPAGVKMSERANPAMTEEEYEEISETCGSVFCWSAYDNSPDLNLDTGASNHFIKDASLLSDILPIDPVSVKGVKGGLTVNQVGTLEDFGKVYYVPEGNINILSFSKLMDQGYDITLQDGVFRVVKPG